MLSQWTAFRTFNVALIFVYLQVCETNIRVNVILQVPVFQFTEPNVQKAKSFTNTMCCSN